VPNLTTLLAMVVFTPALAGCLLLLSWLRHRRETALVVWGFGFITASIAAALIIVARGDIPNFLSIVVGNALLAVAYGILWCGARTFECKKVFVPLALGTKESLLFVAIKLLLETRFLHVGVLQIDLSLPLQSNTPTFSSNRRSQRRYRERVGRQHRCRTYQRSSRMGR
jgi:hypothetical protein